MNSKELLESEIEKLSKNLYLESPDLWIDFLDKMSEGVFDEMVLFFAIKYNYPVIVEHVVNNDLINLDSASKNTNFSNVKEHLIFIATQSNNMDMVEFLNNKTSFNNPVQNSIMTIDTDEVLTTSNDTSESYIPKYLCTHCNHNIFEDGYSVCENIEYKYSSKLNGVFEVSKNLIDSIKCCNCNNTINGLSIETLKDLSCVQNCTNCNCNLTTTGIVDKSKMEFDTTLNKFVSKDKSYHCNKCGFEISSYQKEFFSL